MSLVQTLVRKIQNELNALKVATPLNLGQLRMTDQTPSISYSGSFNTASHDLVTARLEVTFTRSDGIVAPPLVDFAYECSVSPTYPQYLATQGISFTGNDTTDLLDFYIHGYEYETGSNSVTFYIDFMNAVAPYAGAAATISATVKAISTVPGSLSLVRSI